jgi:hypothetical protein
VEQSTGHKADPAKDHAADAASAAYGSNQPRSVRQSPSPCPNDCLDGDDSRLLGSVGNTKGQARLYAMYLSWVDLNDVHEAGDHPFRDGIITVTFAEIAVWKDNPGAQFQLMRKYPLQKQARYALGQKHEQPSPAAPTETKPFYRSSNGDSWSLIADSASGTTTVMHRPNPHSGGKMSSTGVDEFLRQNPESPEHLALRQFIESKSLTPTLLITYDLHYPREETYEGLIEAIKAFGDWWHHLETVWIVRCTNSPTEVRERLKSHIGEEDQLLVIDISSVAAEWLGINDAGNQWLKDNLRPRRTR